MYPGPTAPVDWTIDRPSPRRARTIAASLTAVFHLAAQVGLYALGFALGPQAVERQVLGISLYGVTSVVTFPLVPLAERLGWSGTGMLVLPSNSLVWGACAYAVAGVVQRVAGQHRER